MSNSIKIRDCHLVRRSDIKFCLRYFRNIYPDSGVWRRSEFSLEMEWACHKFLYRLGICRDRTKDLDLDYPCRLGWLYCICGIFIWLFV